MLSDNDKYEICNLEVNISVDIGLIYSGENYLFENRVKGKKFFIPNRRETRICINDITFGETRYILLSDIVEKTSR